MTDLLRIGLDAEEANHNGVAVMDFAEEARPANYETFKQFNLRQCATSRELSNCFDGQRDICRYGLLSHNHFFLACKAIQTQCPMMWPKAYADLFTRPGGLNMEEVKKQLPVLHGILTRGLWLTLLKPEIMVDHPEACSLISQAMNKNQALGAATAETTALSCMANTLLSIMPSSGVTDKGTFPALKEKLRYELDAFVDDEHFIDLFDFIINLGGQNSIHMKNIMRFFRCSLIREPDDCSWRHTTSSITFQRKHLAYTWPLSCEVIAKIHQKVPSGARYRRISGGKRRSLRCKIWRPCCAILTWTSNPYSQK